MLRHTLLSATALAALATSAQASLLEFNTTGNVGTETSEPSTFNDPSVTATSITLGAGITPAANANRLGGSNFFDTGNPTPTTLANAITDNEYFEIIITPTTGSTYDITNFQFIFDHSGTGPNAVTLRSSVDGFAADLATATGLPSTQTNYTTLTVTGLTGLTTATTLRLYAYGATATAGTGGLDTITGATQANVGINSNFVNLPEPASLALIGLAGMAALRRRR